MEIPGELALFLSSGVSLLVGTRDASMIPACQRAAGVRVGEDRKSLTIFVPVATSARTLANLEDNQRIAVTFSEVMTHRTVQVKGTCTSVRDANEDDRALQSRYVELFWRSLAEVGFPREVGSRMTWWPSKAVDVRIESLFEQTPGPSAGRPLVEGVAK